MRIDLFLWYTRIFKSRTIASNSCKKGHIKIDGKSVKPSFDVFNGSLFSVKKKQILYNFYIKDLPSSRVGAKIVITPQSAMVWRIPMVSESSPSIGVTNGDPPRNRNK